MKFLIVALALMAMFSTASGGLCDSSGIAKSKKFDELKVCVNSNDRCEIWYEQTSDYGIRNGWTACAFFGLECITAYRAGLANVCEINEMELGCISDRGNLKYAVCGKGPAPKWYPYSNPVPPMPQGTVNPPPESVGAKNVDTSCLNDIPMGQWTQLKDGVSAITFRKNAGGKRYVQLRYDVEGTPTSSRDESNNLMQIRAKPTMYTPLVLDSGKFGTIWMDTNTGKIHAEWFKLCDPTFHESYSFSDKFSEPWPHGMMVNAADTDGTYIWAIVMKTEPEEGKPSSTIAGGMMYKFDYKLKVQKEKKMDLSTKPGGLDVIKDIPDQYTMKVWGDNVYIETSKTKESTHQGCSLVVLDKETFEFARWDYEDNSITGHCMGNTNMFVSNDGHITWADLGDFALRGMNMIQVWENEDPDGEEKEEEAFEALERNIFTTKAKDGMIQNKVFMNLGDLVETPGGYLATFSGEAGGLDNSLAGTPAPWNLATIYVNKAVFEHPYYRMYPPDHLIYSTEWSDYTFAKDDNIQNGRGDKTDITHQRVTGTNWITKYTDEKVGNAGRQKILSNGKEYFIIWEEWVMPKYGRNDDDYYTTTYLTPINPDGQVRGKDIDLGTLRWGQGDYWLSVDDVYLTFEGYWDDQFSGRDSEGDEIFSKNHKQIFISLLLPSDKPSCSEPKCNCGGSTPHAVYVEGSGGCETCECRSAPLSYYPNDGLCSQYGIKKKGFEPLTKICESVPTHCMFAFMQPESGDEYHEIDTGTKACAHFGLKCVRRWERSGSKGTADWGIFDCGQGEEISCDSVEKKTTPLICAPAEGGVVPAPTPPSPSNGGGESKQSEESEQQEPSTQTGCSGGGSCSRYKKEKKCLKKGCTWGASNGGSNTNTQEESKQSEESEQPEPFTPSPPSPSTTSGCSGGGKCSKYKKEKKCLKKGCSWGGSSGGSSTGGSTTNTQVESKQSEEAENTSSSGSGCSGGGSCSKYKKEKKCLKKGCSWGGSSGGSSNGGSTTNTFVVESKQSEEAENNSSSGSGCSGSGKCSKYKKEKKCLAKGCSWGGSSGGSSSGGGSSNGGGSSSGGSGCSGGGKCSSYKKEKKCLKKGCSWSGVDVAVGTSTFDVITDNNFNVSLGILILLTAGLGYCLFFMPQKKTNDVYLNLVEDEL